MASVFCIALKVKNLAEERNSRFTLTPSWACTKLLAVHPSLDLPPSTILP